MHDSLVPDYFIRQLADAVAARILGAPASAPAGLALVPGVAAAPALARRPVGRPPKAQAAAAAQAAAPAAPAPKAKAKSGGTAAFKAKSKSAKPVAKAAGADGAPKGRVRVRASGSGQKGPQSFKKRLYWAEFRKAKGLPPHPQDEEFLAAAAAGQSTLDAKAKKAAAPKAKTAAAPKAKAAAGKSKGQKAEEAQAAAEAAAPTEATAEVLEMGTDAGVAEAALASAATAEAVPNGAFTGEAVHATQVSDRMPL